MSECLTDPIEQLLERVAQNDRLALNELFERYRNYVKAIVNMEMEEKLRRRVDPSDIVQDSFASVNRYIQEFLKKRPVSFRLWLRGLVINRLNDERRRHYADKRDIRREFPDGSLSAATIAGPLFGERASDILQKRELLEQLQAAIDGLSELDREIIQLRYFEDLKNKEIAVILEIEPDTARKRHARAVVKLSLALGIKAF